MKMSRRRGWTLAAFALAVALVLAWLAIAKVHGNLARSSAWSAELERARAADRSCSAAMRERDADAEAEADVRRGNVQPIFLGIGDDVREIVALGLSDCSPRDIPPSPRAFPGTCEGDLAGPHASVTAYAFTYDRRLLLIAPRQVAAACRRAPR
jgi:hypothetical protein